MQSSPPLRPCLGVILAGGRASRMGGGDKSLRLIAGEPILARIIGRLRPQVADLVISANGDPARLAPFDLAVLADSVAGQPGPLAGVLAGLDHAASRGLDWVVTAPADAPFLPLDLVARLQAARGEASMAVAASGGRTHPVAALWPVAMRDRLRTDLTAGLRKVGLATEGARVATWPDQPIDPFFNVNTPEDLALAVTLDGRTPPPRHPAPA